MAATPLTRSCPISIVSVNLLDTAGQLLRMLFLDREGYISAQQHYVPTIRASNQRQEHSYLDGSSDGEACKLPG